MGILDFIHPEDGNWQQQRRFRKATKRAIEERTGSHCVWCRRDLPKEDPDFTMDHVVPESYGGPLHSYNLVPACRSCNSARGNRPALVWWRICRGRGLNPDTEAVVGALQEALDYGNLESAYSLYYVSSQLASPDFAPYCRAFAAQ